MRVRILGSAAGGALPQWNCGCDNCRAARAGDPAVTPRTQSSIAVSADGERWVLVNASPDVRAQLTAFPPLAPPAGRLRGSGVDAVVLTNADIDHCAGLLVLREGGAPPLYGTAAVREALTEGLGILPALAAYGPVEWRALEPGAECAVAGRGGAENGVRVRPFVVTSKPPPYMAARVRPGEPRADTVGLVLSDASGASAVYVPGVRELDDALRGELTRADLALVDGTFYTDDEMVAPGMSAKTARAMGHAPLAGPGGLLEFLAGIEGPRKVLVHINNTNPVLREGGDARRAVEAAGVEVGFDGMEFDLAAKRGG